MGRLNQYVCKSIIYNLGLEKLALHQVGKEEGRQLEIQYLVDLPFPFDFCDSAGFESLNETDLIENK